MQKFVKSFDTFGNSVSLNYKGEDRHLTIFGGAFSIVKFAFVFYYSISKVKNLVLRDDPETQKNDLFINFRDRDVMTATDLRFDFAYTVSQFSLDGFKDVTQEIDQTYLIPYAFHETFVAAKN